MGKHGDGLLYCRGNWCGWHQGGRESLHKVRLDLILLAWSVPKYLIEKNQPWSKMHKCLS
jgi:hypothetical protein